MRFQKHAQPQLILLFTTTKSEANVPEIVTCIVTTVEKSFQKYVKLFERLV